LNLAYKESKMAEYGNSVSLKNRLDVKLITGSSIVTIVITVVFSCYQFYIDKNQLMNIVKKQYKIVVHSISKAAIGPILYHDDPALQSLAESLVLVDDDLVYLSIKPYGVDRIQGIVDLSKESDMHVAYSQNVVVEPDDEVIGVVKIKVLMHGMNLIISNHVRNMIFLALVVVFFKILTVIILVNRVVTRRLSELAKQARSLGNQNWHTQINLEGSDELNLLAQALESARELLKKYSEEMEYLVKEKTTSLKKTIINLEDRQKQLVRSEKMASLGRLVSGMAHELNTPIGASVTAASHFQHITFVIIEKFDNNRLKKTDLKKYFSDASKVSTILVDTLLKASELVQSFKQVSVDHMFTKRRKFNFKDNLQKVVNIFGSKIKQGNHQVEIICQDDIELDSYPWLFDQVFINLISNSLRYAFDGKKQGLIKIELKEEACGLLLRYCDNGVGIKDDIIKKIFDPFFTTGRNKGGIGLGMHLVYNIITEVFDGSIECKSHKQEGVIFLILIPRQKAIVEEC